MGNPWNSLSGGGLRASSVLANAVVYNIYVQFGFSFSNVVRLDFNFPTVPVHLGFSFSNVCVQFGFSFSNICV